MTHYRLLSKAGVERFGCLTREKHEQMERELAQMRFEKTDLEIALHDTQQALQRQQTPQQSLLAERAAAKRTIQVLSFCEGCGAALTEADRRCAACRATETPAHACTCQHPASELFQGFGKNYPEDADTGKQAIKGSSNSSNVPEPWKNSPEPLCGTCGDALSAHDRRQGYSACSRCRLVQLRLVLPLSKTLAPAPPR